MGLRRVYECTLPRNERISVQPGDIVGIELIHNPRFILHFDSSDGPANYIFNQQFTQTVNLNDNDRTESAQPQILLTVEITTEVPPTTQLLVTTSSTTEIANNGPTTEDQLPPD